MGLLHEDFNHYQRKRFLYDIKQYYWDEPYSFMECMDRIIHRCVGESEIRTIIEAFHSLLVGGHMEV